MAKATKTLILYRSISGFTKRYAEWIAEELGADLREVGELSDLDLAPYRTVVFGGSLHAVGINGLAEFRKRWDEAAGKKLAIFAVGASPARAGLVEEIIGNNFTEEELARAKLFYLRGGFEFRKLDFKNKVLMKLLQWKMTLKKTRNSDEVGMLNAYRHPKDFARRESIRPLVDYIKGKK
jgi:menaquinone-dependent protoporphyrinogen IX oxidase